MTPRVAMIAAVARNGVIGTAGTIPWRIPSDMALFRRMTMGKPIVMGRKQYETVGRPLPGRTNIVLTRQEDFAPPGVIVTDELEAALAIGREQAQRDGADEVMVIGGGEIYALAMPLAERLYISHVDLAPAGEVVFPAIDPQIWEEDAVEQPAADPRDEAAYRLALYRRR